MQHIIVPYTWQCANGNPIPSTPQTRTNLSPELRLPLFHYRISLSYFLVIKSLWCFNHIYVYQEDIKDTLRGNACSEIVKIISPSGVLITARSMLSQYNLSASNYRTVSWKYVVNHQSKTQLETKTTQQKTINPTSLDSFWLLYDYCIHHSIIDNSDESLSTL